MGKCFTAAWTLRPSHCGSATGIMAGTGQACNAGSRILLHTRIYDEVVDRLRSSFSLTVIGDPADPSTVIGPLASRAQYDKVRGYLDVGAAEPGTQLVHGGSSGTEVSATGLFVEPTLYATSDASSRLRREEIFGPIGSLIRFEDEADALRIANESEFGLVAGLWTRDLDRAHRVSRGLESGVVWINTWRAFSVNVPFGGVKDSGVGRELGPDLLEPYTRQKAVWLGLE